VPGEFGDDPDRYASGKARKNYAATSPVTRASGNSAGPAVRGQLCGSWALLPPPGRSTLVP